ncbi:class I SAM-dependent methyltransferase [Reinekea thalattae]|nr:class I SAM-dependent methyltransferase [Reinekea thalattae]
MTDTSLSKQAQQQSAAMDHIAQLYQQAFSDNPTQVEASQWLAEQLPKGAKVLDVGCGSGVPTAKLLADQEMDVLGIDFSSKMIELAQQQVANAKFQIMDISNIDFEAESFDAIACFFSLLMLKKEDIVSSLKQLYQTLKPGGYFLISMVEGDFDYIEIPFFDTKVNVSAYTKSALESELTAAGFSIIKSHDVEFRAYKEAAAEQQIFIYCQRN